MAEMTDPAVQRTLGRIEATQDQILKRLDELFEGFGEHKNDDQRNFSSVRHLVYEQRDEISTTIRSENAEIAKRLEATDQKREEHLEAQDKKLDEMSQDMNRAKGAGWVILGLLGALATFLGAAVLAVLSGRLKFQ